MNQDEAKPLEVELWNHTERDLAPRQKLIKVKLGASFVTRLVDSFFREPVLIIVRNLLTFDLILRLDLILLNFKVSWHNKISEFLSLCVVLWVSLSEAFTLIDVAINDHKYYHAGENDNHVGTKLVPSDLGQDGLMFGIHFWVEHEDV